MGVKVYNLVIVIVDILTLIVKWWYFVFESIYKMFAAPIEVDVKGEIVLVSVNVRGGPNIRGCH